MKLISNDLRDGEKLPHRHVFNGMGYDGDNISPHLAWDEVPAGTKSFVVTCYDPDAPTGSGWWHWIVANLPADTRVLPQGFGSGLVAMPEGTLQTAPILVKQATAAQLRRKGKRTATSLPFTRWMWSALMSMQAPAARWWALTSISIRSPARRLPQCSVKCRCCLMATLKRLIRPAAPDTQCRRPDKRQRHPAFFYKKSGNNRNKSPRASSSVAHSISGAKKRS